MGFLLKIIISAILVGGISELARRNSAAGALLASLPIISLLSMIWLYRDTQDIDRVSAFSTSVVWYVLPSLVLFILLPVLLKSLHLSFYPALGIASASTIFVFFGMKAVLLRFGINI